MPHWNALSKRWLKALLEQWLALEEAAIIGRIDLENPYVVLETDLGGERIIEELEDDPLPRIC